MKTRKFLILSSLIFTATPISFMMSCGLLAEEKILTNPADDVDAISKVLEESWTTNKVSPLFVDDELQENIFSKTEGFVEFSSQDFYNKTGISFLLGFFEEKWKGVSIKYSITDGKNSTYSTNSFIVEFLLEKQNITKRISRRVDVFKNKDIRELDSTIENNYNLFSNFIPFRKSRVELTNLLRNYVGGKMNLSQFSSVYSNKLSLPENYSVEIEIGKPIVSTAAESRNGIIYPIKFVFYRKFTIIQGTFMTFKEKIVDFSNIIFSIEFEGNDVNGLHNKRLDVDETTEIETLEAIVSSSILSRKYYFSKAQAPIVTQGELIIDPHKRLGMSPFVLGIQNMRYSIYFEGMGDEIVNSSLYNGVQPHIFKAVLNTEYLVREVKFEMLFEMPDSFEEDYAFLNYVSEIVESTYIRKNNDLIDVWSNLDSSELDTIISENTENEKMPFMDLNLLELGQKNEGNFSNIFPPRLSTILGIYEFEFDEISAGSQGKKYQITVSGDRHGITLSPIKFTVKSSNFEE